MIFFYLLSGLFLGWSLGANDTGNVFGAAVETRMLRFKRAALIASIFIVLGALLEGGGPSGTLGRLGKVDALGGAFTVSLAAGLAILVVVRTRIPVSTSQTIVGAILGWNFFAGRLTDVRALVNIAVSWITAFVVSGVVAALLFYLFRSWINRSRRHLLEQDMLVRYGLVAFGAIGAYYLGANNIANVVGVFVPVTPFKDLAIGPFVFSGVQQLYLVGALSVVLGIFTYSRRVMRTVGHDLFKMFPVTALAALIAETFVLFIFTSRGLQNLLVSIGLPAIPFVPVSSTQVIVGAVMGIGLAKGGKNIRFNILGKLSLAWVAAPVLAFLFSFVALFITQNVFELQVRRPITYTVDKAAVREMEERGIDTNRLSFVNMRSFESQRAFYEELTDADAYEPEVAKEIVAICEDHPLKVDFQALSSRNLDERFTPAQLEALKELDGRELRRKWELGSELARFEAWQPVQDPQTKEEKERNRALRDRLDILHNVFYDPLPEGE